MNRFECIEYLQEVCSEKFIKEDLLNSLVAWMDEDDFQKFYQKLCGDWEIAPSWDELNKQMEEDPDEEIIENLDEDTKEIYEDVVRAL